MTSILNDEEKRVVAALDQEQERMLRLLEEIVNTDSPSRHVAGVGAVRSALAAYAREAGLEARTVPLGENGDALLVSSDLDRLGGHVLLLGHMDTVFPRGEAGKRPFHIASGRAFGPGVADMKSGLVMNLSVLSVLARHARSRKRPLACLFTPDEEIASPTSREAIAHHARNARAIFNAEPGRPSGNVVTGRKGALFIKFAIEGKAAHSGSAYRDGVNAIEEAAHKTLKLQALTDLDRGLTVNVGMIRGGKTINTVPPLCGGEVEVRYLTAMDRDRALRSIGEIFGHPDVARSTATFEIYGEFLPFETSERSTALFQHYRQAASDIGMAVGSEVSGGCADSGVASAQGAPTLCGTGPVGGNAHTAEEYILLDSLLPRAKSLALSLLRL
ncbi:MAG: M20 family metallopeptidase [Parvibaculaceae bacterium]